jgi:hypothetical protein
MNNNLRCFSNDSEIICARSAADAVTILRAHDSKGEFGDTELSENFFELGSAQKLSIDYDDGRGVVTLTVAQWTQKQGRGLLCSDLFG